MKRLGIYLIYDKQKIIDSYIGYMLGELKSCVDHLVAVCNMPDIDRGLEILERYADEIFYRENIGFDAGGFKDALCGYIGWSKALEYDELVLVNDSIFGPFKPMKSIFIEMSAHKADFWGLATHGAHSSGIFKHIQTYFLVIRSAMLHSIAFKNYWENMPYYESFLDVVYQHEVKFTLYFERLGYVYDVLADTKRNDSELKLANNYIQYAMLSYELIKKRNFPFLKKQQIAYNTLSQQTQENLYQSLRYIDKNTDYDVDLIWENIIRTLNMTDLQRSLHLQYLISSREQELPRKYNITIIIFAEYKEAAENVMDYVDILAVDSGFSIQIISEKREILEFYRMQVRNGYNLIFNERLDIHELCQYDLVCILHDADVTSDVKPSYDGKSYFYCIWDNLFGDKNHISGIIEKFAQEKRLGFLAPPIPNFADYFGELSYGWNNKYKEIKVIVERLQLHCPISEEKPPFRITDNFWIRGSILRCLEKIKPKEEVYLPYLWSYFAQHMGYYSGIVESTDYASMNEVNMQYYLKQIIGQVKSEYGDFKSFDELKVKVAIGALKLYCEKYSKILVYGTGYYAKRYLNFLPKPEACIVSDDQKKLDFFEGISVMYLSEIQNLAEYGIVLCLSKENQKEVIPLLEQYGVIDYFCIP